jgi:hypothetical protein
MSQKKILVVYLSLQSLKINFGSNYCLKQRKMNFEETLYFLNVRKNDQKKFHIFGMDFSVKKSEKKIKKNNFLISFEKKILF